MWHVGSRRDIHPGFWWRYLTGREHLDRPRHRREKMIKWDLKETGYEG